MTSWPSTELIGTRVWVRMNNSRVQSYVIRFFFFFIIEINSYELWAYWGKLRLTNSYFSVIFSSRCFLFLSLFFSFFSSLLFDFFFFSTPFFSYLCSCTLSLSSHPILLVLFHSPLYYLHYFAFFYALSMHCSKVFLHYWEDSFRLQTIMFTQM